MEARSDVVNYVAQALLQVARRRPSPGAAAADIQSGMPVLFYREMPVNKWEGPYVVVGCDGKQVWLDVKDRLRLFSIDKVKEYLPPLAEKNG